MNHVDYSKIKELFAKYGQKFAPSFSVEQNNLVAEMMTKLEPNPIILYRPDNHRI